MSRGMPSMTALLGMLALAGYQNRDKISEWLGSATAGAGGAAGGRPSDRPAGLDGLLGSLGGAGAAGGLGGMLGGGLGELLDRFKQNGHGEVADSWVQSGPNKEIAGHDLERAIGAETLDDLTQHTGLSRQEILSRLQRELPSAVDRYTPEGRLPSAF